MFDRLRVLACIGLAGCSILTSVDGLTGPGDASGPADAGVDGLATDDGAADGHADDARPEADATIGDASADARIMDASADVPIVDAPPDAPKTIAWHATSTASFEPVGMTSFSVNFPMGAVAGDLLVGVVALGNSANTSLVAFTAPAGFSLVRRVDHGFIGSLLVYTHVVSASEPTTYSFTSSAGTEGQIWVSAYGSVDTAQPVDVDLGADMNTASTQYATPPITASAARGLVVAAFTARGQAGVWTPPNGTTPRANLANSSSRCSLGIDVALVTANVAPMTASLPVAQSYGLTHVMVLRPAP